jgi:hypothetical protein
LTLISFETGVDVYELKNKIGEVLKSKEYGEEVSRIKAEIDLEDSVPSSLA